MADWRVFYECLHELVEMCEDERNKMSLRLWKKEYSSLSFEEKVRLADVAGYNIGIRFYLGKRYL